MDKTTLLSMPGELCFLLVANEDILSQANYTAKSLPQKLFGNLVSKYYVRNKFHKASFQKATGYPKEVYYRLNGINAYVEGVKKEHVIAAVFWLKTTYEEAKLLFFLFFLNSISEAEFQKWDIVLRELENKKIYLKGLSEGERVLYARSKIDELNFAE